MCSGGKPNRFDLHDSVILLSDLYVANGAEPWKIPNVSELPKIETKFADPNKEFVVYRRDPETLARTQTIPGQAGLEHRIGGLEKSEDGGVSYDPENHEKMTHLRADKINGIANSYDPISIQGEKAGDLLVIGWEVLTEPSPLPQRFCKTKVFPSAVFILGTLIPYPMIWNH